MKIIRQPNFEDDIENPSERLVAIVLDDTEAEWIAKLMNKSSARSDKDIFVAVADEYELKVFEVIGVMR